MNKELKIAVTGLALGMLSSLITGCGLKLGPLEIPQGIDIHFGINEINDVNDNRGVKPTSGIYGQRKAAANGLPTSY